MRVRVCRSPPPPRRGPVAPPRHGVGGCVCPLPSPVPPRRPVKEEFVHDCAQMELPPGREQGGEGGPPVPPAQSYRQLAPATLQLPKCPRLYPTLPIAPPGKTPLNPPLSPPPGVGPGVSACPPPSPGMDLGVSAFAPHPLGWVWGCQRVPPRAPQWLPAAPSSRCPTARGCCRSPAPHPPRRSPPRRTDTPSPPTTVSTRDTSSPAPAPPAPGGSTPPTHPSSRSRFTSQLDQCGHIPTGGATAHPPGAAQHPGPPPAPAPPP